MVATGMMAGSGRFAKRCCWLVVVTYALIFSFSLRRLYRVFARLASAARVDTADGDSGGSSAAMWQVLPFLDHRLNRGGRSTHGPGPAGQLHSGGKCVDIARATMRHNELRGSSWHLSGRT